MRRSTWCYCAVEGPLGEEERLVLPGDGGPLGEEEHLVLLCRGRSLR